MSVKFDIEDIPNEHKLYYRVHKNHMDNGEVLPVAFEERGRIEETKSMSTDWEKYSTPERLKEKARKPELNAVISFIKQNLIDINLRVKHRPTIYQAHTDVNGISKPIQRDPKIRLILCDLFNWEINIEDSK